MEDYRGRVCFFTPLGLLFRLTSIEGLYVLEYINKEVDPPPLKEGD